MFVKIMMISILLLITLEAKAPVKDLLLFKAVFKKQMVWDGNGNQIPKIVPAKHVGKGDALIYVNKIVSKTYVVKKQVVVENPIPYGTSYIRGTASCESVCQLLFSIDGGKTYQESEDLFVWDGGVKRIARGSEYTHVKYVFESILPHSSTRMAFKVIVK